MELENIMKFLEKTEMPKAGLVTCPISRRDDESQKAIFSHVNDTNF